jgi:hypothetical protein
LKVKEIRLAELITEEESVNLTMFVQINADNHPTPFKAILAWLDSKPEVLSRFEEHGVLKEYGAWVLFAYLQLG